MSSPSPVDDLILWHGAGIFGLVWLGVAAGSMGGFLAKTNYGSSTPRPSCIVEHECDLSMRSVWQLDRSQDLHI